MEKSSTNSKELNAFDICKQTKINVRKQTKLWLTHDGIELYNVSPIKSGWWIAHSQQTQNLSVQSNRCLITTNTYLLLCGLLLKCVFREVSLIKYFLQNIKYHMNRKMCY